MNDISKDKDYQEFLACTEVAFGTGEGLLWYGICARCKNRLLWYATHFQGHSVRRTGFSGTGVIFGTGNPLLWYGADIRCAEQPSVVRGAFSGALGAKKGLLWYAAHFQGHSVRR